MSIIMLSCLVHIQLTLFPLHQVFLSRGTLDVCCFYNMKLQQGSHNFTSVMLIIKNSQHMEFTLAILCTQDLNSHKKVLFCALFPHSQFFLVIIETIYLDSSHIFNILFTNIVHTIAISLAVIRMSTVSCLYSYTRSSIFSFLDAVFLNS